MTLFQVVAPWLLILQSALGGSPDYVLPDANTSVGRVIVVKSDVGRTGITVRAQARQLIDGSETFSIASGQAAGFQPRNGEWKVVSDFSPASAGGTHNLLSATHPDTSPAAAVDDSTIVGSAANLWALTPLTDCPDSGGNHLNYQTATNNFLCGTSSSGGGSTPTGTGYRHVVAGVEDAAVKLIDLTSTDMAVSQGTTTTVLHGNAGPTVPSWGSVVSADLNLTTTTCSNQFVSAISASGVGTCTTDTLASAQHANQGTVTTLLHGNAAGNPAFGSVVSADLNLTTTSCSNQFVTAISAGGVGTCTTDTLASAQHANQGTTTTVLHGNAAGNPSFAGVSLANDTAANQGTTTTLLHGNAAGQPSFGAVVSADITDGTVAYADIQDLAALSVMGRTANSIGVGANISGSASGQVLRIGSLSTVAFGSLDLTDTDTVGTSILPLANGGTNNSAAASNGAIIYSDATKHLPSTVGTAGLFLTSGGAGAPTWGPTYLTATATQSDAVIATYTAITGIAFTPAANTKYRMECTMLYSSTAATTGINYAWDVPAAVNFIHMTGHTTTTALGAVEGFSQRADNVGTSTANAVITVTNVAHLEALLSNGANATSTTLGFTPETANSVSSLPGGMCTVTLIP